MSIYAGNQKLKKLYIGNQAVRKAYLGNQLVYSAGNIVTYHVDAGVRYQEEVGEGESCLSPKTFTPQKAGWTFVGWRADATASGDVLASKVLGDNPVTLYAVFTHPVTVTYYNGSTTASRQTKSRYWNNGNAASPSFALTQAAKSGWSARGWSAATAANGGISYANGATFSRDSDVTLYGMYQQAVTLSYNGNGATGGSMAAQTGYRYYNSNGQTLNASFSLRTNGFTLSGGVWKAWALGGVSGTRYGAGTSITLAANTTMYAVWKKPINLRTQKVNWTILDSHNLQLSQVGEQNNWYLSLEYDDTREVWMVSQYFAVNECDTLTWYFGDGTTPDRTDVYIQDQNGTNITGNLTSNSVPHAVNVSGKTSIRLYVHMKSDEWHRAYMYMSTFSLN